MHHSAQPATQQSDQRLLVLFDGRCALCHASVRWLLRRDHHDRLCFAAAESSAARAILATATSALPGTSESVLVLAHQDSTPRLLARSSAVLACLSALDAPWPQLAALARLIPLPLRDLAYRLAARLRYRLARRYATCPLPPPELRHRFLD